MISQLQSRSGAGASPAYDFTGQRILVTGGARGIGAATCRAFRAAGARVAVGARSMASFTAFTQTWGADGYVPAIGAVSDQASCAAVVAQAVEMLGGLDVLVNSAGVYDEIAIDDIGQAHWDETMAVNVGGTFFCMQAALPALEARQGCIVNLGSDAGLVGASNAVAYAASKGAVVNMTRAMAVALAQRVRVNCVCPGFIWTEMVERAARASGDFEAYVEAARAHSPMRRIGTPEEVAAAILYLASDAAGFVNGVALPMDGGGIAGY
ncbi:SDR family NAD(P)-dependent oxidoreductase [Komagataeibacter sp. FNDCF1]|uniref:SDR family NAD(P)-dependent oxidoreductase n=1 Tax=Komagataeibacter sp. FNDCF1 TaxID=2878681 RepID=UPI001E3A5500|nr:SDR family NAD(P)-dependent oxidoreductase [Komagataeibacter sp. FNDCF1]MCE2563598.1 SDR family oxidoreductase [Komagataeibacter sp. FNDCF1]